MSAQGTGQLARAYRSGAQRLRYFALKPQRGTRDPAPQSSGIAATRVTLQACRPIVPGTPGARRSGYYSAGLLQLSCSRARQLGAIIGTECLKRKNLQVRLRLRLTRVH